MHFEEGTITNMSAPANLTVYTEKVKVNRNIRCYFYYLLKYKLSVLVRTNQTF